MKATPFKYKLGSAPTLAGIGDVIQKFYGGERKQLRPETGGASPWWAVLQSDGTRIANVEVRLVKGRYVFGSL